MMIRQALGEPAFWMVMFRDKTNMRLLDTLIYGRWKHVLAVGYFPDARCWIQVDPRRRGIWIDARREEEAGNWLDVVAGGGGVLRVTPQVKRNRLIQPFWCVPAIAAMVGSRSGALRPDRLWRDLISEGAEIVADVQGTEGRSGRGRAREAG